VEAEFERSLDLDYRRAAILERLGRDDEALAAYDRIVQVRPTARIPISTSRTTSLATALC